MHERGRQFNGKVLVTGASGHLGANLVRRLLADGRDVRVLVRGGSNNEATAGLEVERTEGDLRNREDVGGAVAGCETIYHCAAKISTSYGTRQQRREIFECNVLGTRNLLDAARTHGVQKVVVSGSLSAVGDDLDDPKKPCDESIPFYPFQRTPPYGRTKVLVEHECLKAAVAGLDVCVATSTGIVGPADYKPSRMGATLLAHGRGKLRAYIPGGHEFVAARDIVEGHVLAMARGKSGERYIFTSEFLTLDDVVGIFEELTGQPRPRLRLPAGLMAGIAEVISPVMTHLFPNAPQRLTPGAIHILRKYRHADCSKAKRELGFVPTSVREAFAEAYEDFVRRGLLPHRPSATRMHPKTVQSRGAA